MTIVILLVLIVLLWVAVLAPSAWRRFKEREGVGSIDHFHHQLQLLEHAGPKTVAPAYRLHTAVPGASVPEVTASTPSHDTSRPKLVLLRPTEDTDADVEDGEGMHYQRVGVLDRPEPAPTLPPVAVDLRSVSREQARRRCTVLLRCLAGIAVSTGLIGIFPGMHLAWVFTGLFGVAVLALAGLIAYAREIEAEQDRRRSRREFQVPQGEPPASTLELASAGYPGAWDEEEFDGDAPLPQVAAR